MCRKELKRVDKRGSAGCSDQSVGARGAQRRGRGITAGNNTGKWTGGNSRATPVASSATSATGDSVPSCVYDGCFHPFRSVCVSRRRRVKCLRSMEDACVCARHHAYACLCVFFVIWAWRGVRGFLLVVVTPPALSSVGGSIIMYGLRDRRQRLLSVCILYAD